MSILDIIEKAKAGERLSCDEGRTLFREADLVALGEGADAVRRRLHPDPVVTYIVDRNINYSNSCITYCKFCAFYRPPGHPEEYTLTQEELGRKIQETIDIGGVQILMQGGHHPHYKIDWYEDMLRFIKKNYKIHVHGFSPPEIHHFSVLNKMPIPEVIRRLREAGLDSIPGGGAEVLVDRVRKEISPLKTKTGEWLDVMRQAHLQKMKTTATMMYGHAETYDDRVEHLDHLRELQDETGGFTAFICWNLQTSNTELEHLPMTGGHEYLKTLAVSRLFLDNIPNLQSSWVTQGEKVGQMALRYGANDMGSTMLEENVVSQAGADFRMTEETIRRVITDFGFVPKRRNMHYKVIEN